MTLPHRIPCPTALVLVLLAAPGLQGCYDLDLFPDGTSFSAPRQLGGLPLLEGSDLLDASFADAGVFESYEFVERQPVRVVVDRFARPLIVGIGAQPSGLRVQRLTEDGASDATFGTDGVFLLPNQAPETVVYTPRAPDVLIDDLDRILLFSTRTTTGGAQRAVVMRLEPGGILDPTFGDQGRLVLEPAAGASETLAASLSPDSLGGFLACATELGPGGPRMFVVRFDQDGALDGDFGQGGRALGPEDEASVGVRAVPDLAGRIVVAGSLTAEPGRIALWRFDALGSLDPGFGVDGFVTVSDLDVSIGVETVDVGTDPTGRIVLLGNRSRDLAEIGDWHLQLVDFKPAPVPVFDVIVWRFLADGSPDAGFAGGGSKVLAFNSGPYYPVSGGLAGGDHFDAGAGLFLDDAGRIVIAGWSDPGTWDTSIGWANFGPTRPFLVRLTSSGALDQDFHGSGHVQLGLVAHSLAATYMRGHPTCLARDAQGRWVLAGGSTIGSSQRVWRVVP